MKPLHPRYKYLCPTECEEHGFSLRRSKKCQECPLLEKEENFQRKTEARWDVRFRKGKYRFKEMLGVLNQVVRLEEVSKDKLSIKNARLLGVYISEKSYSEAKDYFKDVRTED